MMESRRILPPQQLSSLALLLMLGLSCGLIHLVTACPSECSCKWKGGKQSVECINRGLRIFPGPIDAGTQVLDLSGNSFETLPSDHFMRLSLINLQKIYLPRCRLSHINSRAFRGLSNLVDLDLSNNVLREAPSPAFADCQGLMRLILSGNPISHLQRNAFMGLDSLTTLEMTHCGIELIDKGAFEGLLSLEWLKLNGNKLRRMDGLDLLPVPLKGVWLEENPWECDCRLLELRVWLAERKVANSIEPRCATPNRLTNATLKDLGLDNFACTPQLSPTTMYQKIGEGKNVSLLCKVTSTPESSLEWWFNGQLVSNSSLNVLVETTNGFPSPYSSSPTVTTGTERKSELLILNATAEENGTFLCIAKNPAGLAMANFTLRVLTPLDTESYAETVTSIVGNYPNLFLVVVSTVAVIGVVVLLFGTSLLICKCSRLCGVGRRRRERAQGTPDSRTKPEAGRKDLTNSGSGSVCGVKMDRHLSETSTLTTHTKSNGSVFLLSTSSELGDSNPDLIEGVKRVEADGHETCFTTHLGNGRVFSTSEPSQQSHHTATLPPPSTATHHLEPYSVSAYPMDYGLPKGLNVATLVRRSPSYPSNNTLPPTYDLAKYPKEYLSPTPLPSSYAYGPGGPMIYTSHGPSSSHQYHGGLYPTTYLIPHPGTYAVYGGGGEEYVTMGYVETLPGGSAACSCGPIMEENEEVVAVADKATGPEAAGTTPEPPNAAKGGGRGEALNVKARLQRQLTTQINESPDEGYEDESAEGAEI